ncbi:MAG TPA: thioredoxin family protein [Verrucomicrobiae bacterium]|nr:thioredoxin family protein [Verrucomicrobiae bacterium]
MSRTSFVALTASLALAGSAFGLNIGDKAPSTTVKMKNVDGKEVSIADVTGKEGTLVIFSCNHCPFVKAWQGRIASIGNAAQAGGIGVIAINSNDPTDYPEDSYAEMQKRAQDLGFKFPYVVDATSDVARAFGATRTPEAFLFDKDGKLVYHGAIDDSKEADQVTKHYLQDAVSAVEAGKTVPVAESKFVGCGIKFRKQA